VIDPSIVLTSLRERGQQLAELRPRAREPAVGSIDKPVVCVELIRTERSRYAWMQHVAELLAMASRCASDVATTALLHWPRVEQAEQILAFVAAGGWAADEVEQFVGDALVAWLDQREYVADPIGRLAARIIRRAKAERRVFWCQGTMRYEALPAWRHRPLPARHPWPWPAHASGRR
jgi:hypothetical protein